MYEFLGRQGFEVGCIQGDMTQEKRSKSLADFKEGKVQILVATDVAARGLDIPKVELVVNQTFPLTIEDYIHRIGRTGSSLPPSLVPLLPLSIFLRLSCTCLARWVIG